ncbi:MAG: M20/M25/M40 family metallo-hydrolase [Verrucomicrobia bacterium]|nr:M20/M25/M40 family metallo-hydrolase [Verrucomicrobiota bacterium]
MGNGSEHIQDARLSVEALAATLSHWADIASGTDYTQGVEAFADVLEQAFASLEVTVEREQPAPYASLEGDPVAVGPLLRVRVRPDAPVQILLLGHMDTVYGDGRKSKPCVLHPDGRLVGPGVADMKGGLLVMLESLRLLEKSSLRQRIGWQVLLTPDEETGSHASHAAILAAAREAHVGMVFESSLADGSLIRKRMGNGTFRVHVRGRAAHTGRDFAKGRNAVTAMARIVAAVDDLNGKFEDALFNPGRASGGGALNVVPDSATAWFSVRIGSVAVQRELEFLLPKLFEGFAGDGIEVEWRGGFTRPPAEASSANQALHQKFGDACRSLGLPAPGWRDTGGSPTAICWQRLVYHFLMASASWVEIYTARPNLPSLTACRIVSAPMLYS